ncbi:CDP-diacylglycerol--glycerol-3-phosphate 3-phosphatidyltransferase [Sphingomonas jaspsi]|jgi:CDP-diacylglycerol--glycerol-3-phosphate 3-phosphatidyltransferase|uniref:CDP-diacylglycerol--glycerol-3-phosphate 3-phosphatidyltransferase n=1 Tax=Sphingomonas jaspsi TaxID=392409 RepID=UPI0004B11635|nr:CDP-diacylglycerol--glycerol-3-phosphate 3-phosphatidyltransferase [Sphingomonas jaspsi]
MLTLPNLLTLSRILAVPILVFLLWKPTPVDYAVTYVLYCVVGITDYFDGYLARAQGQISRLGQFLDPIADKIMVAAVIVMLMASRKANGEPPILQDFSIIPALVILLREIIVSGLREFLGPLNVSVPVSKLAKWKTTFQLTALGALILGGALPAQHWVHVTGLVSLWAAAALTLITGYDYLRIGLKHMD